MAGQSNTTANSNTFNGYMAGYTNSTGHSNTFIGYYAGRLNTVGSYNTFNGYQAGNSNTTGNYNTFVGRGAGSLNTIGGYNTFIGYGVGYSNTIGNYNSFIGLNAGYSNTTGEQNTFNGYKAGFYNTTGGYNLFNGYQAGYSNKDGNNNTFNGYEAGYSNSTGTGNVFLGYQAGYNETGSDKLYIDNSSTSSPLIYGDFSANTITINGALSATSGLSGDGSGLTNLSGSSIISGTVADARIASTIARDSEIMTTVLANDGSSSTLDADKLDGNDSSAFMSSSTDNWVNTSGDTMTGNLTVGGIIESTSGGIKFPDGSIMTTATTATVFDADTLDGKDSSDFMLSSGGTMNGSLLVYGTVDIDQDLYVVGNIYAESDARSKKDIKSIESSLSMIKNIQGVSYKWKAEEKSVEGRHYGVVAQEVEKVLPEIVTTGKNGRKKVAYMELVPVLIEAMKEQQKTVEQQQKTISELLGEVIELKKEMKLINSVAMADAD
jgi:hypothetical protein